MPLKSYNEKLALWSVTRVSTMTCAYAFAILALIALPQAYHESFIDGFHPLPLVTWISQSFLQLVLLSIVMVGQTIQGRASEKRSIEQFDAVMETLKDIRLLMEQETKVEHAEETELTDLTDITSQLLRIEKLLTPKLGRPRKTPT